MGNRIFKGALRDDPLSFCLMDGDLTEVEICDLCGNETEDYLMIGGLIVCESCREDFGLEECEDNTSEVCALCGWPINKPIDKKEIRVFLDGIKNWLEKKGRLTENLRKKLESFSGKETYLCRYDFFHLIKDLISLEDERLSEEFEKEIASKYEFYGGIVS